MLTVLQQIVMYVKNADVCLLCCVNYPVIVFFWLRLWDWNWKWKAVADSIRKVLMAMLM